MTDKSDELCICRTWAVISTMWKDDEQGTAREKAKAYFDGLTDHHPCCDGTGNHIYDTEDD